MGTRVHRSYGYRRGNTLAQQLGPLPVSNGTAYTNKAALATAGGFTWTDWTTRTWDYLATVDNDTHAPEFSGSPAAWLAHTEWTQTTNPVGHTHETPPVADARLVSCNPVNHPFGRSTCTEGRYYTNEGGGGSSLRFFTGDMTGRSHTKLYFCQWFAWDPQWQPYVPTGGLEKWGFIWWQSKSQIWTADIFSSTTIGYSGMGNNDNLAGGQVEITGGTGSGQIKTIASSTSTTLTISGTWTTTPDATSQFRYLRTGLAHNLYLRFPGTTATQKPLQIHAQGAWNNTVLNPTTGRSDQLYTSNTGLGSYFLQLGRWQKLEGYIDLGATGGYTGTLKYWLNDLPILDRVGVCNLAPPNYSWAAVYQHSLDNTYGGVSPVVAAPGFGCWLAQTHIATAP